jgi:Fe-S oxidoreductase
MYGPILYQAFREIKRAFDPHNLLNPGKIVDAPPLASNLRYGPAYQTPDLPTTFDFSADGGVTRAAELCAGVGECRKKRGGAMCPSFQATGDELHSTRGRANTLRLALTGQLDLGSRERQRPEDALTDPAVMAALDLCLECKACKSECPTNVDMARLKAEALDQHHKKHGLPWRNWLFGNVANLSAWGCALAPMSNWWVQSRLGRWMNEKAFGIDRRRRPPPFVKWQFGSSEHVELTKASLNPQIVFFPDTFVRSHDPYLGQGAVALLERVSSVVIPQLRATGPEQIVNLRCCGRPMISNGMLDAAVALAKSNVELLSIGPWADDVPIIACEPSCILTIKDDYPALLQGELGEKAKAVAARCFTFEEFLLQSLTRERRTDATSLTLQALNRRILVQGHCHQRALVGMGPTMRLLQRIPGAEVIDLDAGCCGMAGSFGYEKEHYEISRLVGEQRLFPAIRAAGPDDVIVAPGFSCRLQIEHFTGRKALHPATLLASLLVGQ